MPSAHGLSYSLTGLGMRRSSNQTINEGYSFVGEESIKEIGTQRPRCTCQKELEQVKESLMKSKLEGTESFLPLFHCEWILRQNVLAVHLRGNCESDQRY